RPRGDARRRARSRLLRRLGHLDRHAAGPLVRRHERQLDLEEAILVHRLRRLPAYVRAQRDHAPEWPVLDLELMVDATLGLLGPAVARDRELAALHLQRQLVWVDARRLGSRAGPRR